MLTSVLRRLVRLSLLLILGTSVALPANAESDFVLVTEWGELGGAGIAKIDPATNQIVGRLSMPGSPRHIDADTARRLAYVSQHYGNKISVIKADSLVSADLVIPGLGLAPIGVALTPDGTRLLVATRGNDGVYSPDDRLDVVSLNHATWPPTAALVTSIPTGLHPIQAFVDHTGQYAVVTVRNQPAILVIDLNTYQIVWQAPGLPPTAEPEGGCLHPTQNIVYVALHGMNILEVLDLDSMKILQHVPIINPGGGPPQPSAVRFTPDGSRAYVSAQTAGRILMFNTLNPWLPVQDTSVHLPTGPQPHDIVWLPGNRAYVANTNNMQQYGSLSIISNYNAVPSISAPILTDLAGPLSFAYFEAANPTAAPVLDFFYAIHIHVPNDYQLPTQTEFNQSTTTVTRMADILEAHGARGTFESVFGFAEAALLYQGALDNILKQLEARGHEVAAHAHNGDMFQRGYDALQDAGVQNITTIGGRTAIPGDATTSADGVQLAADVGFTVKTENWSPTDTFGGATWCSDFGLGGNTMYTATNNIMHPWRPDYINGDICAHNPAGLIVSVDHAIPDWLQASPPPLTDANFNVLKPWFEASFLYLDSQQVNAWGFVSHQTEYNYPGTWTVSDSAIAALDRFLTYVDGFVAQNKVRYATARDIATRLVQGENLPPSIPPVHLTVVSHNEEPGAGRPDYTADINYYLQNRNLVKLLAETITSRGAKFNFESDWNYLKAVAMFDTGSVTANTNGKNIVRWMKEDLGVEVDPHAHETQYNYADVAYLIEQLGMTPTKIVGGFLYDPPDNSQGWEQHENGIYGWMYPSYFWRADYLWGAGTYQHQGKDDSSSGIWRPKDRYDFYVDDPNQRLLYIGGCNGSRPLLLKLLDDIESGNAPSDGFYTADLGYAQDWLTAQSITELGAFIDSVAPLVAQGRLHWATLSQMADLWQTQYGSQPFRYVPGSGTPTPDTFAIESVETWVTAPNGNQIYTRIVQPVPALYAGQRFPALIAIPGGTGPGAPLADNIGYRDFAASGFVVVVFNPEGRGTGQPGNLRSEGVEDCNGFVHQDDLKAVVEHVAALPNVDAGNIGVQTSSFGIAIGAGAVGRYPNLPVAYLVDVEGPHDNRVITFYDAGRELSVCGHLSTVTDPSPANVAFWTEREAVRHIGGYPGRYLRMQAEDDHAQDSGYFRHAIEMIAAVTQPAYGGTGVACWTRMNGSDVSNPINTVYPLGDTSQYPTWLTGRLSADHPGLEFDYIREMSALVSVGGCVCSCPCPCHADPSCDGVRSDILDVVITINVAFRGTPATLDANCPNERTDVDCSGFTDIVDVVRVVAVAFRGADPALEFCDPCAPILSAAPGPPR